MIIVRLIGGLGNQMFQYAMARQIAVHNNTDLKLDIFKFATEKVNTPRTYALDVFKIKASLASQTEINSFDKYRKKQPLSVSNFLHNLFVTDELRYVEQRTFTYEPRVKHIKDDAYITGASWPSYRYFSDINGLLIKEFELKDRLKEKTNSECLEKIRNTNSVSVHFRRGDYVHNESTNKHHGVCSVQYYQDAIAHIQKHVSHPSFYIFSDEINWVKAHIRLPKSTYFVSGQYSEHDYTDLYYMTLCKHHITANSTFSWWGAWLSQFAQKVVVTPKTWFNVKRNIDDLIPHTWIRL